MKKFKVIPAVLCLMVGGLCGCEGNNEPDIQVTEFLTEKSEAKSALESFVFLNDYSNENQSKILDILTEYKGKIDAASSVEEISSLQTEAQGKISELKTKAEEEAIALTNEKNKAIAIVQGYAKLSDYDENEKTLINEKMSIVLENINSANTIAAVNELLDSYKAYVDSLQTKTQKELIQAKLDAINELENYIKDKSLFSPRGLDLIDKIILSAKENIENAISIDEVDLFCSDAKADIDEVPTKAEEQKTAAATFMNSTRPLEGVAKNYYTIDKEGNINFEGAVGRYDGFYFGDRDDHQYVIFDLYLTPDYINTQYSSISFFFRMWDTSNTYEIVISDSSMCLNKKIWSNEKGGAITETLQTSYYEGLKDNQTYHVQLLACEWSKSFVVDGKTIFSIGEGDFTVGYTAMCAWESSFSILMPEYKYYDNKNDFLADHQSELWGECVNADIKNALDTIDNKISTLVCEDLIKEQIRADIESDLAVIKSSKTSDEVSSALDSCKAKIDDLFITYSEGSLDDDTKDILLRMKNSRDFLKNSVVNSSDDYEINSEGYLYQKNSSGWTSLTYSATQNKKYESLEFDFSLYFQDSMWSSLNMSFNRNDDHNRYALVFNDIFINFIQRINGNEVSLRKINYDKQRLGFVKIKIIRNDTKRYVFIDEEKLLEINNASLSSGSFTLETWQTTFQISNVKYLTFETANDLISQNEGINGNVVEIPDIVEPTASNELKNILRGKKLSILADSISTYEGISNNPEYNSTIGNNGLYYYKAMCSENDTWWMQTVNATGMELCVNNAWAGSRAYGNLSDPSTACGDRAVNLHNDHTGVEPDVIVTYLGTNDYDMSVPLGSFNQLSDIYEGGNYKSGASMTFATAYAMMLHKINQRYPNAKVFCFTVLQNKARTDYDVLNNFNNTIKSVASYFNADVVDLCNDTGINSTNLLEFSTDKSGVHPNRKGMDKYTECFINKLESYYVK